MSPEKKEIINGWYEKADEDILAAEVVINASPLLYDVSAFHAQQAGEKYIKAIFGIQRNNASKSSRYKRINKHCCKI